MFVFMLQFYSHIPEVSGGGNRYVTFKQNNPLVIVEKEINVIWCWWNVSRIGSAQIGEGKTQNWVDRKILWMIHIPIIFPEKSWHMSRHGVNDSAYMQPT